MNIPQTDEFDEAKLRGDILTAFGADQRTAEIEETLRVSSEVDLPYGWSKKAISLIVPRLERIVHASIARDSEDSDQPLSTRFSDACDTAVSIIFGANYEHGDPTETMAELYATHCALLAKDPEYQKIYRKTSSQYGAIWKPATQ